MAGVFDSIIHLQDDSLKDRYLPLRIGPETYSEVRGGINLKAKIIPVMDVRLRFGKESTRYNTRTCIIVVNSIGTSYGPIVDKVSEIITISEQDVVEKHDNKGISNKCLKKLTFRM